MLADPLADSSSVALGSGPAPINFGWLLMKTVASLIFIIALIFGMVLVFKRYFGNHLPGTRYQEGFRIIARLPLQPKQSLALVKVFDRIVLIGITDSTISMLSEYKENQEVQKIISTLQQPSLNSDRNRFFKLIKKEMEKN